MDRESPIPSCTKIGSGGKLSGFEGFDEHPIEPLGFAGLEVGDEEDEVADEAMRPEDLDAEEIGGSDGSPMSLKKGLPGCALATLRRWLQTMSRGEGEGLVEGVSDPSGQAESSPDVGIVMADNH